MGFFIKFPNQDSIILFDIMLVLLGAFGLLFYIYFI